MAKLNSDFVICYNDDCSELSFLNRRFEHFADSKVPETTVGIKINSFQILFHTTELQRITGIHTSFAINVIVT